MCHILPEKYIASSKCSSDTETQILCAYVSGCEIHWEHTFYDPSSCTNSCTLLTLILIFVDREQPVQHALINCVLPCAMFSGLLTMWVVLGMLVVCWLPVQNIWSQTATVSFETHAAPYPAHIHLNFSRFTSSHSKKLNHFPLALFGVFIIWYAIINLHWNLVHTSYSSRWLSCSAVSVNSQMHTLPQQQHSFSCTCLIHSKFLHFPVRFFV